MYTTTTPTNNGYLFHSRSFGECWTYYVQENLRTNVFYDLNKKDTVWRASTWNSIKKNCDEKMIFFRYVSRLKKMVRENRRVLRLFRHFLLKITGFFSVFVPFSRESHRSHTEFRRVFFFVTHQMHTVEETLFVCHQAYILYETCKILILFVSD